MSLIENKKYSIGIRATKIYSTKEFIMAVNSKYLVVERITWEVFESKRYPRISCNITFNCPKEKTRYILMSALELTLDLDEILEGKNMGDILANFFDISEWKLRPLVKITNYPPESQNFQRSGEPLMDDKHKLDRENLIPSNKELNGNLDTSNCPGRQNTWCESPKLVPCDSNGRIKILQQFRGFGKTKCSNSIGDKK